MVAAGNFRPSIFCVIVTSCGCIAGWRRGTSLCVTRGAFTRNPCRPSRSRAWSRSCWHAVSGKENTESIYCNLPATTFSLTNCKIPFTCWWNWMPPLIFMDSIIFRWCQQLSQLGWNLRFLGSEQLYENQFQRITETFRFPVSWQIRDLLIVIKSQDAITVCWWGRELIQPF